MPRQTKAPQAADGQPTAEQRARLAEMISGYQRSQMILVAARLGLADLIAAEPRSVEELAQATQSNPRSLGRFLRTLAGHDIFRRRDDARYDMTSLAQALRSDLPGSLHPMAMVAANDTYRSWGELYYSVTSGNDGFAKAHGMPVAEYRDKHPESNLYFNAWMAEGARRRVETFLDSYPFAAGGTVVDVGGGDGTLLLGVLRRHANLRGVLFDLPRAVADFKPPLAEPGVVERLQIVGGSFFDEVPPGGDFYILSLILHNWPEQEAMAILERCRSAIKRDGRLIVLDQIVPDGVPPASMSDLNMLVNCGALERTEGEWRALLAHSGFRVVRIAQTPSYLEAQPAAWERH